MMGFNPTHYIMEWRDSFKKYKKTNYEPGGRAGIRSGICLWEECLEVGTSHQVCCEVGRVVPQGYELGTPRELR
jgi:hypothetical protein